MAKKQALGKGLGALFQEADLQGNSGERVRELPLSSIHANPDQPRQSFDPEKLAELAQSIKEHGVMQPLLVIPEGSEFLLAAGERRWRAAELAGLDHVPCIVRELSPGELAEVSLIENIQREDLTPLEEARAYSALVKQYGYTQEQLAARLGKSRPHVANTLRLLQLAPQEAQALSDGRLSAGHARALLSVSDSRRRGRLFTAILKDGLSVRQAEAMAKALSNEKKPAKARPVRQREAIYADLERRLTASLGLPARLQGSGSKGRLVVEYSSDDDLQNILERLGIE